MAMEGDSPQQTKESTFSGKLLSNYKEWEYDPKNSDWINISTGEYLSGYTIP